MPFSRYLSDEPDGQNNSQDDLDHPPFSAVNFQLPNLILNTPTVAPGGGADALPAGLYPSSSLSWFSAPDAYHSSPFDPQPSPLHPHKPSHFSPRNSSSIPFHNSPSSASSSSSPQSTSPPFSSSNPPPSYPTCNPDHQQSTPFPSHLPLSVPHPLGFPVYSSSGFDLISLLSRVVTRPYPTIYLGPVDLSCSFVVTDTRRFDSPVVYASPSFLKLTGYDEHEVLGRNCRFLQAPGGHILRGQERMHTSRDAVALMRKNILAHNECQVSIINYRKDGTPFINMVSVIPLRGGANNAPDEADQVYFHLGFQVDLGEQPKSILSKLKDGSYVINYSTKPASSSLLPTRDWRTSSMTMRGMSKDLRNLLADSAFTSSIDLSTATHASTAIALSNNPPEPVTLDPYDGNKPLHMFLLDRSSDFVHVVSLKGAFLYVAPAVRTVLGYDPGELVGRSLTEFCHPADSVPLMRELKEASATPGPSLLTTTTSSSPSSTVPNRSSPDSPLQPSSGASPRPVNLLFRIQAKGRGYVWVECRGRLHIEPGKGRKAIILSGRLKNMPRLQWGPISRAGGIVAPSPPPRSSTTSASLTDIEDESEDRVPEREFWGMLSSSATFLYVGAAVRDVIGWGAGEVIGKPLADFVSGSSAHEVDKAIKVEMSKILANAGAGESSGLACDVLNKDGDPVYVHLVLYRPSPQETASHASGGIDTANRAEPAAEPPIVFQVKRCEGTAAPSTNDILHPPEESVFDETDLDRSSSWQYELQELKFKNQRLAYEAASLEATITKKIRRKQSSTALGTANGLGSSLTAGGRPSAGPRMTIAYAPHPHASSSMHPSQSAARFASTSQQGIARPGLSQPPHQAQPPPAVQPSRSSILSRTAQLSHPSSQQQPRIPQTTMPPPAPPPQGYDHQEPSMYLPPPSRMHQSTESTLQGWSSFHHNTADRGLGPNASGLPPPVSYSAMPMKRSWDSSLRDPGGGGGGAGGA